MKTKCSTGIKNTYDCKVTHSTFNLIHKIERGWREFKTESKLILFTIVIMNNRQVKLRN